MKFFFLKFNKNRLPDSSSLRPLIFNVNLYWSLILFVSLLIFTFASLLGLKLFVGLYSESYKKEANFDVSEILDVNKLERTIKNREKFISTPREIPPDPSI